MRQAQKPAEPRMEDVLASIKRAIHENGTDTLPERLGGTMAEMRVKTEPEARSRHDHDSPPPARSPAGQGFAGILSGRERFRPEPVRTEPTLRRQEPETEPNETAGQTVYQGYYGAKVAQYPGRREESYQDPEPVTPTRLLPPPTLISSARGDRGLLSESSSDATHAAFNRLAETVTRQSPSEHQIADMTHELLEGMLKQWLDDNLPEIVERLVREEIERVVRRPRR